MVLDRSSWPLWRFSPLTIYQTVRVATSPAVVVIWKGPVVKEAQVLADWASDLSIFKVLSCRCWPYVLDTARTGHKLQHRSLLEEDSHSSCS